MNQLIEQNELVKEIHYAFENVKPKIIGRIYKIIIGANAKYMWDLNYFCRLNDEIGVYIPSSPYGENLEDIETKLNQYILRFETAKDWKKNKYFKK
jgi:hypothetical protein